MEQNVANIDTYAGYIKQYGWPMVAVVLSPVASWRLVQYIKLTAKRVNGYKPSPIALDLTGFAIVFGLTYYAWTMYSGNALFVALVVGFLHTSIVKAVFHYAPKPVVEALAYGVSDNTMMTIFVGKDARTKPREVETEDKTRVLTPDEIIEITKPK